MRKEPLAIVATAVLALVLAGCGSSKPTQSSSTDAGSGKTTEVKATVLAASTLAPIYSGIKRGVFANEGIDLKLTQAAPSTVVPAVVSGSAKIGYLAIPSILLAKSKGLPIRIIANAGAQNDSPVHVLKDSPIQSYKDLAGKRVAVPNLGGLGQFAVTGALIASGVDPKSVSLVEVPFGDMETALDRKTVDAIWLIQPFVTLADKHGKTRSLGSSVETAKMTKMGSAYFFASEETIAKEPELIARFVKAVEASTEYGTQHWDEMVSMVPTFVQVPQEALGQQLVVATFGKIPVDELKTVNDFMVQNKFLTQPVDIDKLVWTAPKK